MKGVTEMIDLYAEAKMRQQERLQEAQTWQLQKSLRAGQASWLTVLRGRFQVWLGGHLPAPTIKPQTQYK
jgi:hypothetical protein